MSRLLEFEHARANLVAAARQGLGAQLTWLDGEERNATTLALDHLLPLAAEGLDEVGVSAHDRDRYLEVVEAGAIGTHRLPLAAVVAVRSAPRGPKASASTASRRPWWPGRRAGRPWRTGRRPASTKAVVGATTS